MSPEPGILGFLQHYSGAFQVLLLLFALAYTHFQLQRAKLDRLHANLAAINERVFTHNAIVLANPARCAAVAEMQKLRVPAGQDSLYWAYRAVHLGHIHILSQVWELSGRPTPGSRLPSEFAGWQAFARDIVAKSLAEADARVAEGGTSPSPEDLAGSDLWRAIATFDVTGKHFNAWLRRLASGQ
jgi:hypothetical protein